VLPGLTKARSAAASRQGCSEDSGAQVPERRNDCRSSCKCERRAHGLPPIRLMSWSRSRPCLT